MGSEDATIAFHSEHLNYDLKNGFYPIAEFNCFHVARPACDGAPRFADQVGGLVPAIGVLEGGDLISLDSQYATMNREIMTGALEFAIRSTNRKTLASPTRPFRLAKKTI